MLKFKLPSLLSPFVRSTKNTPPFDVTKFLAENQIQPPTYAITNNNVPYLEMRRILFMHEDKQAICPIRSHWKKALIETVSDGMMIPFSNIKGCLSSKSGLTDFEEMRHHPKSSANIGFHIWAYAGRVEELAEQVFNGTIDCAKYKDKPANIVRQEWDKKMWLANDGGSHRSAAVWHIDREQGNERHLPSRVTSYAVSQNLREQCETHSVWLFKFQSLYNLPEVCLNFKQSGILLSAQSNLLTFQESPDVCLIVNKSDPRHHEIAEKMTSAFNMSDWVHSAHAHMPKLSMTQPAPEMHPFK